MKKNHSPMTYKAAGVDINAGNNLVQRIKHISKRTHHKHVLGSIGHFAAFCQIPKHFEEPLLVAATDGVGTKLKLAIELKQHQTIGIDLVAMCVNDLLVCGAQPLFFLDYYATSALEVTTAEQVIQGIAEGCQIAGCALIGGETAEMPGLYQKADYDLAGFCVGVAEKNNIITGELVKPGDSLIAIASSGPHANGYSLIRAILKQHNISLQQSFGDSTLGDALLMPTKIYSQAIQQLSSQFPIHAMAHITGGGLIENLPRVLPDSCQGVIHSNSWDWPEIFKWLQQQGNIATDEMYRTFNCGIGMVICTTATHAHPMLKLLQDCGEQAWILGSVAERPTSAEAIQIQHE